MACLYTELKKFLNENLIIKDYYQDHYLTLVYPINVELDKRYSSTYYDNNITKIMLKGDDICGYIDTPWGCSGWYTISPRSRHRFSRMYKYEAFWIGIKDSIVKSLKKEWGTIFNFDTDEN